ncbi:MAG: helix-turn-helix transcriptional regulator [Chloroflexi bacterium]|nr:helix-turn-helix transcriptional regulator [Chloroflexota bacterium]
MIGNALRNARIEAGLSQEELGLGAGVDRSYISEIERDIKSTTIKMFVRLCVEMGTKPSALISVLDDE